MTSEISRRNIAKGAAWALPALAVAEAAPAMAASCTPKSVATTSAAKWSSSQIGCTSDNGDPEYHTVQYTLTNEGPDALPVGLELDIEVTITVLTGEEAQVEVQQSSSAVNATVSNVSTDNGDGTTTLVATVKVLTASAIAVNDSATVTILATYGVATAEGDVAAEEKVTAESPQVITDSTSCTTTTATVTVSGASNGTSYTSPASCSNP